MGVRVCLSLLSTEILSSSESVEFLSLLAMYLPVFFVLLAWVFDEASGLACTVSRVLAGLAEAFFFAAIFGYPFAATQLLQSLRHA
jgi:hypothetical protein